ncbi:MAG: methyltransferase [Alphaproteobacteria bacterium]
MAETHPAQSVMLLGVAYWASRCLHIVADLGVADALDSEPETAASLAKKLGINAGALHRVMRALTNHGIFEIKNGRFSHNAASRLLREDAAGSMRSLVRLMGLKPHWDAYRELDQSVKTGKPAIDFVVKGGLFGYLSEHPEDGRIFDEAMTGKSFSQIPPVIASYDFTSFKTIADIGGGAGHLLYSVLDHAPQAKGVLFDLPEVIERAKEAANARVTYVGGDFFKTPIPPCDAYMIMTVLHDWSDEEAAAILRSIKKTAPNDAKLVIIESVVQEGSMGDMGLDLDIEMLAMTTGRERTREEWAQVLEAGGWRLSRVIPTGGWCGIVEGTL